MCDPREEIDYTANLILTVFFDDIEFTSNVKGYTFTTNGEKLTEDELKGIVSCNFRDENEAVFEDIDLDIVVTSVKKL
jgi:hypothetical protein